MDKEKRIPWNKDKSMSKEARKKDKESHLGKHSSLDTEFKKGMKIRKGKHHSEETRKKMSKTRKGKRMGEENPSWKGGSKSYLRKMVLVRDDYTCQICGLREPEIMEVDHILPKSVYPKLAKRIDNMITLCPNCHKRKSNRDVKIYHKGGIKWQKILSS